MTRPTKPIAELLSGGGRGQTTCPRCEKEHAFLATNSYRTASMGRRRLRQCRLCNYAESETVPPAVPDRLETEEVA